MPFQPFRRRVIGYRTVISSVLLMVLVIFFYLPSTRKNVKIDSCKIISLGNPANTLLRGTLLTPDGPISDGCVLIQSGRISRIGHSPPGCYVDETVTIIECRDSVISPGFINTHEHIEYSTVNPLHSTGKLYNHRHDWRVGLRGHSAQTVAVNGSFSDAIKWGELRHLFSGTTSIVGGYMADGLTRNLDFAEGLEEGLNSSIDTWDVFPLDDLQGIIRNGDCDYGPRGIDKASTMNLYRYIAHVAEGVDAAARNEFMCLSSDQYDTDLLPGGGGISVDILSPNFVLVHALGLSNDDFDLVAARNSTVVWSPRSNIFLYGKTLDISYLLQAGITVALGTDWLPTGSATMGREASCGFAATKMSYGHVLESKTLWEMMTINAAKVAGFNHELGSLEVGKLADVVVFSDKNIANPYASAVYAPEQNIELVMRGGKILVAGTSLKLLTSKSCEHVMFGVVGKIICVGDELGIPYASLEAALGGVYPAILPGIPHNEPICTPSR